MASDLELEDHSRFQERFWKAERIAWIGFLVLIIIALLGLTGSGGLLARAEADSAVATIEYPRISRWQTGDKLTISFKPATSAERVVIFSPEFGNSIQLEDIQPLPVRSEARPEGETMIFSVPAGSEASVHFHIRPSDPGMPAFVVSVDGTPVHLSTLVLP